MKLSTLPEAKQELCNRILAEKEEPIYKPINNATVSAYIQENKITNVDLRMLYYPNTNKQTHGLFKVRSPAAARSGASLVYGSVEVS